VSVSGFEVSFCPHPIAVAHAIQATISSNPGVA
jgi:hypothetical protein